MDDIDKILPFQYEPKHASDIESSDIDSSSSEDEEENLIESGVSVNTPIEGRSKMAVHEWCRCNNHCTTEKMRDIDCICCHEWALSKKRIFPGLACVTQHKDLDVLCKNKTVLISMWPYIMRYKKIKGPIPNELEPE